MAGAGEIRIVAFDFAPEGWQTCKGGTLNIAEHRALYGVLGTTYGGDGKTTFGLPDFRGPVVGPSPKFPVAKSVPVARGTGGGDNHAAYLALNYIINSTDEWPYPEGFLGEIRAFAGNYDPRYWMECSGSLLSIHQNTALFALLYERFGGDGTRSFAVPELRGRTPVCADNTRPVGTAFGYAIDELGTGGEPTFVPIRFLICTAGIFPRRP
jgi:microcystin-dependent protein